MKSALAHRPVCVTDSAWAVRRHGSCWRTELATTAFTKPRVAVGTKRFVFAAESRSRNGLRSKPATDSGNSAATDDFFDEQGHTGNARVIVDLTSSLQIVLGYTYRDGDVISYAVPPRPDLFLLASELRPVTTFGTNPLYTAYRLRGQTNAVSVSAGYALTKYLSVQVAYEYAATSHDPLQYENHLVEAKIAFAY